MNFNNISLKKLLTLIILLTTLITSIFGFAILINFSIDNLEDELIRKHVIIAELVGNDCRVGLEFVYYDDLEKNLNNFKKLPDIIYSEIQNLNRDSIMSFRSEQYLNKDIVKKISKADTVITDDNYLYITKNIQEGNNYFGLIYLQVSKSELNSKVNDLLYYFLIVELFLLIIAYLVGNQLQNIVALPIIKLANISKEISEIKDYTFRLEGDGKNEIADLYNSFNEMIKSIDDNITQKDKITLEFEKSEERLKAIGKALPDLVYIVNELGEVLNILNSDKETQKSYLIPNCLSKKDTDLFLYSVNKTISTGKSQTIIFSTIEDEKPKWYEGRTSILNFKSADGKNIIIFVPRDITNRMKAELELQNVNNNLEHLINQRTKELSESNKSLSYEIEERKITALSLSRTKDELVEALKAEKKSGEMKSNFVSLISHEYKTPLTVMLITTSILRNYFEMGNKEKFNKSIIQIENSINDITAMIDEVLFLGKAMANEIKVNLMEFDMLNILEASITRANLIDGNRHKINIIVQNKLQTVMSDAEIFSKVIDGILSNAIKFSEAGKDINITVNKSGDEFIIKIEDHGKGMGNEELKHLFEPFYKYEKDIGLIKGTGMGLAIVDNCIKVINGRIEVKSKLNIGSTFTVFIPKSINQ